MNNKILSNNANDDFDLKEIGEGIDQFHKGIDLARDKIKPYKKIRFSIKLIGVIAMFVSLYFQYWLAAVSLWILFFPDLSDFVRFFVVKFKY